ncbi:MAG TPA: hypothetical protein VGM57_03680 [Pseudolabrys sp.]|jgi:hypothetical protein
MSTWLKGALFGALLLVWTLYDLFISTDPIGPVLKAIDYIALVASVVILFGAFLMAKKKAS